ncbi:MAG TPA: hypothetical protein VGQ39_00700 [Pyrinomonadaceae bacterium]|jgi:hypothetical protein|nr:hypothetical protein [Pyrinomonadaceae bacterium]
MQTKSIVLIVAIVLLVLLAGIGGAAWLVYAILSRSLLGYSRPPTPHELKQPRIVTGGANLISRSKFLEKNVLSELAGNNEIGRIDDISVGEWDQHTGLEVVVAGSRGALVLDLKGTKQSHTQFQFHVDPAGGPFGSEKTDTMLGDLQVVDLEGDGICEYLGRGSLDGAAVFDHFGKLLWSYGKRKTERGFLRNVTVGDLNQDGIAEFVVSWDGIQVFDKSGKKLVQHDEEYGDDQLEVVDTDGDGTNEIISCDSTLKIRNPQGAVIKETNVPGYFGNYSLLQMPGNQQTVLLTFYDGRLLLIDLKAEVLSEINAPLSKFDDTVDKMPDGTELRGTSVFKAEGVWIKLASYQPKYLAVISNFAGIDRSVLDIFDSSGKIIYQEVLPEECSSVAALPSDSQKHPEELLVGGESTIWKYVMQ